MKKSKFSESQIIKILSQIDSGQSVTDMYREHGISQELSTFERISLLAWKYLNSNS